MDKGLGAVIFDLDGTLIDTEKIYSIVWPQTVRDMGFEMSYEQYLSLRSLGRPFALNRFREWYGSDFDYDLARRIRKTHFDAVIEKDGIQLKPGAIRLLTYLREKGITTAIATQTDLERASSYMELCGLSAGLFDRIISSTMVDEGKPSPKVYQYACNELGLAPSDCIAIEDAPNGVLSAYRAGCRVIMVPDLSQPDKELSEKLYACVDSLDDIMKLI